MTLFETSIQDLRYGIRKLFRDASTTSVSVLALALGIGINAAVFTAYQSMIARPLDARDPGRMVNLALIRQSGAVAPTFSYSDYQEYRDGVHSFSGVIAQAIDRLTVSGVGSVLSQRTSVAGSLFGRLGLAPRGAANAEFASAFLVSENYFSVLGAAPIRGHGFESIPIQQLLASPVVLISENYWQNRLGGDPAILGKAIHLNGAAFTIAGITPHDFTGCNIFVPDFWMPISLEPLVHPGANWLADQQKECCRLFARLAPGAGIPRAQAEMNAVAGRLRGRYPPRTEAGKPVTALVWPGSPFPIPVKQYGGMMLAIVLIMAAAGMVLAVACVNVTSLQMARAKSRQQELGMRLSLGASRLRIVRQLLTESTLLALLAGFCALPLSWALTRWLAAKFAEAMPAGTGTVVFHVTPDMRTLIFSLLLSLAAGLLFGLLPALESSRSALAFAFNEKSGTSPVRSRRIRDSLVTVQVAVSLLLMISGGMFIRSSIRALQSDPSYESKRVIDLQFQFPEGANYPAARKLAVVRKLGAGLAALPGVAGVTNGRSPEDVGFRATATALDGPVPGAQAAVYGTFVQANYFDTLGIPFFLGHGFTPQAGEPERVAVLSESAARALWPGQNPVGRRLRWDDGGSYQVAGVVRDTRGVQLDGSDSRMLYLPLAEGHIAEYPILIRTSSDPAQVMRVIDPVIASVDPDLIASFSTLDEKLRQTAPFVVSSLSAVVSSAIGLLGLLLASLGIYGTVRYVVALRTREIGIRMAVGARQQDAVLLILRQSLRPVLAGVAAGICLAIGVSYRLRSIFYGLQSIDGVSLAVVSVLFLAIALLSAYFPSRRASRVDPMVALRYE